MRESEERKSQKKTEIERKSEKERKIVNRGVDRTRRKRCKEGGQREKKREREVRQEVCLSYLCVKKRKRNEGRVRGK